MFQAEDGQIAGGAQLLGDWVWPLADFSIKATQAVQFDAANATVSFVNVDGGAGGQGAIELRYSASYGAVHGFEVNVLGTGVNQTLALPLPVTGNTPEWLFHVWRTVRVEGLTFAPGMNTVTIRDPLGRYVAIDEVQITTPTFALQADPHRRVGTLPAGEQDALIAFLNQLDGSSPPAPPSDAIFSDPFERN